MDAYIHEWISMLLRWLHVITSIAWIGSSFFFMHLDATMRRVPDIPEGQGGAAWQVHGGGFYEMRKYLVAPAAMPEEMTWHKWQSYWTWISGFFLLCWVYYGQAQLYLIDPAVLPMEPWQASLTGLASLALGWLVYDFLCKSPLAKNDALLLAVLFAFVVAMSYAYTLVFSGRGALVHTGALMATMMSGVVFFVIVPNQKKVVASLIRGETPDPALGKAAKQRSAHNNYLTLPVLFLMLSNHYPVTYANSDVIPALVVLITFSGAIIRYFYNVRHSDHAKSPWWALVLAALALWTAFYVAMAASPGRREQLGLKPLVEQNLAGLPVPPAEVTDIVVSRCSMCHAAEPVWNGIHIAPKGVRLDAPQLIQRQAQAIRLHSVMTHAMPPNNITEMSSSERRKLAQWLAAGR